MDVELDLAQRAVVEHAGGPLRVLGGFGTGTSTALRARRDRLEQEGRVGLLLHHRDLVPFAVELLNRHGAPVALATPDQRRHVLEGIVTGDDLAHLHEIADAIVGFQTSWLGDEELRVHADAAGVLARAERLIEVTHRYLEELRHHAIVDAAGAVVQAGLKLRDHDVLAHERARFDEVLVDDVQLATFAEARLLTQLAGRDGPLVVGGNLDAAVASAPLASSSHLARFARRFACPTVVMTHRHRVAGIPILHLAEDAVGAAVVVERAGGAGAHALHRHDVEDAVGREWPLVVVGDAADGTWPRRRPRRRWFDEELFHGPDVSDDGARDRRWLAAERARFRVAVTRATEHTIVVTDGPVTPFVGDLLRVAAPIPLDSG